MLVVPGGGVLPGPTYYRVLPGTTTLPGTTSPVYLSGLPFYLSGLLLYLSGLPFYLSGLLFTCPGMLFTCPGTTFTRERTFRLVWFQGLLSSDYARLKVTVLRVNEANYGQITDGLRTSYSLRAPKNGLKTGKASTNNPHINKV